MQEIQPDGTDGLRKPAWSGLEQVLLDSPFKARLFQNLDWIPEVERGFVGINRGNAIEGEASAVREAYYSIFRRWRQEETGQ